MTDKDKGKGLISSYVIYRGKRQDKSSGDSSPETKTPPAKSPETVEMDDVRKILATIQENTNKLLEDNRTLRQQYTDLQDSLNFHIAKIEELVSNGEPNSEERS